MKKILNIKTTYILILSILSILIIINCDINSSETLEERANKLS